MICPQPQTVRPGPCSARIQPTRLAWTGSGWTFLHQAPAAVPTNVDSLPYSSGAPSPKWASCFLPEAQGRPCPCLFKLLGSPPSLGLRPHIILTSPPQSRLPRLLTLLRPSNEGPCDYVRPTWIIRGNRG